MLTFYFFVCLFILNTCYKQYVMCKIQSNKHANQFFLLYISFALIYDLVHILFTFTYVIHCLHMVSEHSILKYQNLIDLC